MDRFNRSSTFTKREMGSQQKHPNVFHFSHPHPLECATSPSTGKLSCFGCKLSIMFGEDYYQCKTCAFSLHYVCYKMPLITHHPAHSRHDLVLFAIPSSPASKATLNCMACGHNVTGFCYHCAECSIFCHTICLALPLSLTITFHPHKINLEFSPPYDFFCDLCNKPSYNGWLYRCNLCEFDTHVACAVENLEPQSLHHPSFPQSIALLRQLASHQVDHTRLNRNGGDSRIGYEIMRLVTQQIGGGISKRTGQDSAVAGWDKRLHSPKKKHNTSSEKTKIIEILLKTEPSPDNFSANLEERTPLRDKMTPLSDKSTPLSHVYSDAYFSTDLAKSYSTHDRISQVGKDVSSDQITRPKRIVSNSGQAKEPFGLVNWPSNDSYKEANENKLNAASFKGGRTNDFGESSQKVVMKNDNESLAKWAIKDQIITKSDSDRYSRSCWRKLLPCCL